MWAHFKGDFGADNRKITQGGKGGHSLAFLAP
jgi:hypothetical protein